MGDFLCQHPLALPLIGAALIAAVGCWLLAWALGDPYESDEL